MSRYKMKTIASRLSALALALLLATPALPAAEAAWTGSGTAEDPYLITTAAQLQEMENDLSAHYQLAANVDMSGVDFRPIGNETTGAFTGSFDGNGYTISNLTIDREGGKYVGLIGYCEGSVTRVVLDQVTVNGARYVGSVAGYCAGGCTLADCVVSGTVSAASGILSVHVGGLVGELGEDSVLSNCSFSGNITSAHTSYSVSVSCVGGLVGQLGANSTVNDCAVVGSISGYYSTSAYGEFYCGGMVGYADSGMNMTGCSAEIAIDVDSAYGYYADYGYTGGLVGCSSNAVYEKCSSKGNIHGNGYYYGGDGGIVGYSSGGITNCESWCEIDGLYCSGGIVANFEGTIDSCVNYGTVAGVTSGGIVGETDNLVITNCTNYGEINSVNTSCGYGYEAGGIVGCVYTSLEARQCINWGDVFGTDGYSYHAAGIARAYYSIDVEILGCMNYGDVTGARYAAGILDGYGVDLCSIADCSNYGDIVCSDSGYSSAGIFLNSEGCSEDISIQRCFNGGRATCGIADVYYCVNVTISECVNLGPSDDFAGSDCNNLIFQNCVSASLFCAEQEENLFLGVPMRADGIRTLEELKRAEEWLDWDFEDVWYVDESYNSGLPMLKNLTEQLMLNEIILVLSPGESADLNAYWRGEETQVSWDSTDEDVARVDGNGMVTARGNGTCWISAELEDGTRTNCVVYVITCSETLTLEETAVIDSVGDIICLTPEVSEGSNETLLWTTSNSNVATVDSTGEVTGYMAGAAVITVTAYPSWKSASCTVTVSAPAEEIYLDSSLTINVGEDYELIPETWPDPHTSELVWSSSDETIATVADGVVVGVAPGQAIVTVAAEQLSAACVVTVLQPAAELTLAQTALELEVGSTAEMQLAVTPENSTDSIQWSSSKTSVATVSKDGIVTAKKVGTALITAKASSGASAYCTVTVKAKSVIVSAVDITTAEADLQIAEILQLSATVTPSDATDKGVVWSSSDERVVTVSTTGCVTALAPGQAVITATASNGLYDTCVITVAVPSSAVFEIGDVRTAGGEEVEVPVYILHNVGIAAFTLSVDYDATLLTPVSVESGGVLSSGELTSNADTAAEDGDFHVTWYQASDSGEDGLALVLRFCAADTTGTSTISLEFGKHDICNSEKQVVGFGVQSGRVKVIDGPVGDVYRDDIVNMKDIVYFSRWFNGQETLSDEQALAADIHYDNTLNVKDLTVLAQLLSESIPLSVPATANVIQPALAQLGRMVSTMSTAQEEGDAPYTITVSDRIIRSEGEVTLTVRGEQCPGIAAFRFCVEVPDGYQLTAVNPTELTETGTFSYNEQTRIVSWYHTEDVCLDGDLFTIQLQADADTSGTAQLGLSYNENDFFAAETYQNVAVEVYSGDVRVLAAVELAEASMGDSVITVTLDTNSPEACRVMAAFYYKGRFVHMVEGYATVGAEQIELEVDNLLKWDSCKLFVLDAKLWIPLCKDLDVT